MWEVTEGTALSKKKAQEKMMWMKEEEVRGSGEIRKASGTETEKDSTARGKAVSKGDGEEVGDKRRCEKAEEEEEEEENRQS